MQTKEEHEPRKLFVGGIPRWGITPATLRVHFARYGQVVEALVMLLPDGMGRGFGFVEFEDEAAVLRALDSSETDRHNAYFARKVEVKRAERKPETRSAQTQTTSYNQNFESRKVFVGGLRDKVTTDQLVDYFKKFGTITDVVVMYDKLTNKPRGFGFVTFDAQEATNKVLEDRFHFFNGTKMEVKNAEPRGTKYRNGHYHVCPANSYGAPYSPYTVPYFPHPYTYIHYPYYVPYGIYMMNQRDTFHTIETESDSKAIHIKENQQRVNISTSLGMQSNPVKQDRVGISTSVCVKSDPVKQDSNNFEEANR